MAVVTAAVRQDGQPLGCSIEPVQDRMVRAQEFAAGGSGQRMLSQNPGRFAEQMERIIGDQEAHVFGLPSRTSTAVALIAADIGMKRLGFGKSDLPIQVPSYFDFLDRLADPPRQSLIRWWFDYGSEPVDCDP